MLGVTNGAAMMVDRVDSTGKLVVAEGIETSLAARQMGMKPVWALGSVGAIGRLPVGSKIDELIILGEEGSPVRSCPGRCARRWWAQGRRVTIIMPKAGLSDMK